MAYYDGTKLLSLKDINGKTPEIYMCTGNRTGGKTTYYNRLAVNRFLNKGQKFCLVNRFVYELGDSADKFFKDIGGLFFQGHKMTEKSRSKGLFKELFLDGIPCGYSIAINSAENLKHCSHLLSDVDGMYFDEFQSESNHYCPNEVSKFISIHTSIARGQGKQIRYVPVYMMSNAVSLLNPYFSALGVSSRLRADTRFLRGDGWVLEKAFVDTASTAQRESGFNRAFANNSYVAYSAENVYLNDNTAFVEKLSGTNRYIATIKYNGKGYAIREYSNEGFLYVDNNPDESFGVKLVVTSSDHNTSFVMLKRNDMFLITLRNIFEHGCFRFKNLECKEAILACLNYNV